MSRSWPVPYRPLRPRTLALQVVLLVVAEVLLYVSYASQEARFHWATHALVGLTAAAVVFTVNLLVAARPARGQVLALLGFHLLAMWPDIAFRLGVPHRGWMDYAALGHVSSHYFPGGDDGWLVLALLASGGYAWLLWRWLRARHLEAARGLPPALGVGGAAVLRPQEDPRERVLAHEHLGSEASPGEPLLLLHGLGGTAATWRPAARLLAAAGHRVLLPDLLGYGSSLRVGTRFRLADQAAAVLHLLDHHDVPRVHLVAHSWGCAVAGEVARDHPDRVARLTLVAPAAFADLERARDRIGGRSWLARAAVDDRALGGLLCGLMCLLRPLFARLVVRMEPDVPVEVARDGVQHSYPAYRDGLRSLWQDNPLPDLLAQPSHPVTVLLGDQDTTVPPGDVLALPLAASVDVVRVDGTHGLPYESPELVAGHVLQAGARA